MRYDFGVAHDLVGRRLHDVRLGRGRLYDLTHAGRGLLLNTNGALSAAGWDDRVDHVVDTSPELEEPAVLVRPDGHVVWVGDDRSELAAAMQRWFGAAAPETAGTDEVAVS